MDQNEGDLNGYKPYLSEVLDVTRFRKGRANIIVAPCHSGKTTAASKIMEAHARRPGRVLYLIDTTAGRDSLLLHKEAQRCTEAWLHAYDPAWWGDPPDRTNFAVMTYHQFGYSVNEFPTFLEEIDLIICDEMHNLIKYKAIEVSNNEKEGRVEGFDEQICCRMALAALALLASYTGNVPLIVIMTATSNMVTRAFDQMHAPYEVFNYNGLVYSDRTGERRYYADFKSVISQVTGRAVIFVPTITLMKEYAEVADNGLDKVVCLWSIHNKDGMTDEQLEVREALLKNERIPEEIDVLFINAAYETSINIRNEDFQTMIIHSSNADTQVQVRGRIRHDIATLYLYDKNHEYVADYFPKAYLDRWLTSGETDAIALCMNLKNEDGRPMKWRSIWPRLEKDGMTITKKRVNNCRLWHIHSLAS